MIGKLLHQRAVLRQELIQVRVINAEHSLALADILRQWVNTLRNPFERVECFLLNAHSQYKGIIGQNFAVVQNDVLVISIDVSHSCIYHINTGFKHELLQLFIRVASRIRFEVALFVQHMVMWQAARRHKGDVRELQVADRKQCFDE